MSGKSRGKAKVHISKPEPPPFLQRMREQIVANEGAERKEQSEKRKKNRPNQSVDDVDDDDYTVVKLDKDGLTEEEVREYKKIKKAMETQYKIEVADTGKKQEEFDINSLIDPKVEDLKTKGETNRSGGSDQKTEKSSLSKVKPTKRLSYGSSSEED